jgi:hypothetical protein
LGINEALLEALSSCGSAIFIADAAARFGSPQRCPVNLSARRPLRRSDTLKGMPQPSPKPFPGLTALVSNLEVRKYFFFALSLK